MQGRRPPDDSRLAAARYQVESLATAGGDSAEQGTPPASPPRSTTREQRASFVDIAVDQAIRRGEFDDLPGAGKPLENLHGVHDPDWWIRRKIEREQLTGLGPPALTLRTENGRLDARLDDLVHDDDVRRVLAEFNARVVEARRQLQGGPPVVTTTRDVEAEVSAWRERRAAARHAAEELERLERERVAGLTWRERRAERRRARG